MAISSTRCNHERDYDLNLAKEAFDAFKRSGIAFEKVTDVWRCSLTFVDLIFAKKDAQPIEKNTRLYTNNICVYIKAPYPQVINDKIELWTDRANNIYAFKLDSILIGNVMRTLNPPSLIFKRFPRVILNMTLDEIIERALPESVSQNLTLLRVVVESTESTRKEQHSIFYKKVFHKILDYCDKPSTDDIINDFLPMLAHTVIVNSERKQTVIDNIIQYIDLETPLVNITSTIIMERFFEIPYLASFPPGLLPIVASYVAHSEGNDSFE